MDEPELRRRFAANPVARLATVRPDGRPHLVPVVFAVVGDTIFTAIDAKPKRSRRLQRLVDIAADPHCCLLVDHYDTDWSQLWWVRADGVAAIIDPRSADADDGLAALVARYPQYRELAPVGPLIRIDVSRWTGWSAHDSTRDRSP